MPSHIVNLHHLTLGDRPGCRAQLLFYNKTLMYILIQYACLSAAILNNYTKAAFNVIISFIDLLVTEYPSFNCMR